MYQTSNYLERRPSNPSTPRASTVTVKWSNPFAIPAPLPPPVQTTKSFPYHAKDRTSDVESTIQRSNSEGFYADMGPAVHKRTPPTSFHAVDLMERLELADERGQEEGLVREADFRSSTIPSLSAGMCGNQALLAKARQMNGMKDDAAKTKDGIVVGRNKTLTPLRSVEPMEGREGIGPSRSSNASDETESLFSHALTSLDQLMGCASFDIPEPMKKTKAQHRIDLARNARMRLLAEKASKASDGSQMNTPSIVRARSEDSDASSPPALGQIKSKSFDGLESGKKSKAQQRIELARATRMRIVAENAAKAESECDIASLSRTPSTDGEILPSLDQTHNIATDIPQHSKKTKAQQRVELARATRMRIAAELATKEDAEDGEKNGEYNELNDIPTMPGLAHVLC